MLPSSALSFSSPLFCKHVISHPSFIMDSVETVRRKKRTKPKLDIWNNFEVDESERRAKCLCCEKKVMSRADVIKLHLKSCEEYRKMCDLEAQNDSTINRSINAGSVTNPMEPVKVNNSRKIE